MENIERYDELSLKILKIGEALIMEGEEKEDFRILNIGNFIIFISSLIYDENDIKLFSELCSMLAAKKMMESGEIVELLNELTFSELQELINKIKNDRK
jgi:hypothetical protein